MRRHVRVPHLTETDGHVLMATFSSQMPAPPSPVARHGTLGPALTICMQCRMCGASTLQYQAHSDWHRLRQHLMLTAGLHALAHRYHQLFRWQKHPAHRETTHHIEISMFSLNLTFLTETSVQPLGPNSRMCRPWIFPEIQSMDPGSPLHDL